MPEPLAAQTTAVMRVLALVEACLEAPLDVAGMADEAAYSLYYFCRMFNKLTHHSPHDYLLRRRLTVASQAVLHSDARIIDLALRFQFNSHEGFTRAFGRMLLCSPTEARRRQSIGITRRLPPLQAAHLRCLQRHAFLRPTITPWPAHLPPGQRLPLVPDCAPQAATHLAAFDLSAGTDDLGLVCDWLRHTWLFYAPYTLATSDAWLQDDHLLLAVTATT